MNTQSSGGLHRRRRLPTLATIIHGPRPVRARAIANRELAPHSLTVTLAAIPIARAAASRSAPCAVAVGCPPVVAVLLVVPDDRGRDSPASASRSSRASRDSSAASRRRRARTRAGRAAPSRGPGRSTRPGPCCPTCRNSPAGRRRRTDRRPDGRGWRRSALVGERGDQLRVASRRFMQRSRAAIGDRDTARQQARAAAAASPNAVRPTALTTSPVDSGRLDRRVRTCRWRRRSADGARPSAPAPRSTRRRRRAC